MTYENYFHCCTYNPGNTPRLRAITCTYVNPFTGTNEMGHTYPGATVPFGMVQLSPETDTIQYSVGQGYAQKMCTDTVPGTSIPIKPLWGSAILTFRTGHSDLGDFLVMPTGKVQLNPAIANPESGYRSRFSHDL
ncbi:MAG: hypothetical protein U0Z17_02330 [Bacteroidales bacterium]